MTTAARAGRQASLLEQLSEARRSTDSLFEIVREDALFDRPIAERHRIIFYLGHLEAFDWNLFHTQNLGLRAFHPEYNRLFAFGIDPVDGGLPTDRPDDWPSSQEVRDYKNRVRHELDSFLNTTSSAEDDEANGTPISVLLHTAIEHRLMHAETLAYMFHRLPYGRKIRQQQPSFTGKDFRPVQVNVPAGIATLGLPRGAKAVFGWDNEYEAHQVNVAHFQIDKFMVTNGEYMQFVLDGGYRESKYWTPADWEWINEQRIGKPAFWIDDGNSWLYRGMFETVAPPLDSPVYASHAEANAYARWAGKALPTEAQWHRAAYGQRDGRERDYPWGSDRHFSGKGNFDLARWDPAPVHSPVNNVSEFGVVGMLGNGWEWTSSVFRPFPGFAAFPFYPGYSANFFDGKHFVMKGGSPRTAAVLLRRSFRNWFQPHYQYVYAGFRCVSI